MNQDKDPAQPERRDFLVKSATVCMGAAVTLVPAAAGLAIYLDPLRRKSSAGELVQVTTLSALAEDGTPRRFEIIADRTDAWNKFPAVPIGAIYLRRVGDSKVEAFNVTCPHAGCPVEYTAAGHCFLCPCHDSKFNLNGSLVAGAKSPSPRGLDSLEVEVRNSSEVWVRFQNFEAGKAEKIPLA